MGQAEQILGALGGWDNIKDLEACITRIRVSVGDEELVDEDALKNAGAFGVVSVGPQADSIVEEIEKLK